MSVKVSKCHIEISVQTLYIYISDVNFLLNQFFFPPLQIPHCQINVFPAVSVGKKYCHAMNDQLGNAHLS